MDLNPIKEDIEQFVSGENKLPKSYTVWVFPKKGHPTVNLTN